MQQWYEQSEALIDGWASIQKQMFDAWSETQKNLWGSWAELTLEGMMPTMPPGTAPVWREMMSRGLDAWFGESAAVARTVAEQVFAGQNAVMSFLKLATRVWETMSPHLAGGADWQPVFNVAMNNMRKQFMDASAGVAKATQDMTELWNMYLSEMQTAGLPWLGAVQASMEQVPPALSGDREAWLEINNLYWDAYEQTLGRMMQSPMVGATREINALVAGGFDEWVRYRRRYDEYQSLIAETWFDAFEQLMGEVLKLSQEGQQVEGLRDFLKMWGRIADGAFTRLFGSAAYIETQSRMMNASMAFQLKRRELLEIFLEANDMPTRTEIDEAHRRIHQLNREVKTLKKALARLEAAGSPADEGSKSQPGDDG